MLADRPPVSSSRSTVEASYASAGAVACCTYKLPSPTARTLASLASPPEYASFCRSSSSSGLLPHLFLAGTSAADQRSNQLHVVGYVEETGEVECSCRLIHPPEIHAVALVPSLDSVSLSRDDALEETAGTKREERRGDETDGQAGREERSTGTVSFFTAFPDPGTRYATDRCVLWRSGVEFPLPAFGLLDGEEGREESQPRPRAAAIQPSIVSELSSARKRFDPIRKLVVPRGDTEGGVGAETAAARGSEVLVMMEGRCEVFKATDASYETCMLLPADSQHRFSAVTFDPHEPRTIIAAQARDDSLGGFNVFGNGGTLRVFDVRENGPPVSPVSSYQTGTGRGACACNPHGPIAAPLSIDCNPNLSFSFVTGASDGSATYWDRRLLKRPVLRDIHSHWVTSVSFNGFHDQLLLTASTDNTVKLHHAEPLGVSKSPLSPHTILDEPPESGKENPFRLEGAHGADAGAGDGRKERTEHAEDSPELISSYEGSEDSVVAVAWAADDAWAYAALTAEGRISFHQVPPKEKYRILL
uniref:WD domain, G-beta repeat-containing protein n=1 Tax=Neospora caninum (strain Liverpool) TaxID=572307 RepID=A0A0F7U7W4_NEOCL|nr:TPA: WD domain, G-beta repeat-containing protein [Neospora caninum Liverpool]